MRRYLFYIISFLFSSAYLVSCNDSDDFTTSRSALLTFSTDTIKFDTVISTIGSSTRQMMVYNRNADGVRVMTARMKKGSDTPFRVNVHGSYLERESGAKAYDFEVRSGDSLRVFAEVTVPERGQDTPQEMIDTLIFTLESGVEQGVILSAVGQDAYIWKGKVIDKDTALTSGRPYIIYDSLSVRKDVTLHLESGVQLYFHDGANLWVHGRLIAKGTKEKPVVFRGDRTDRMFDYLPYDNTPSRWGGIRLKSTSTENELDYVDIHSASYGIACDSADVDVMKLTIKNSILHNIGGEGLGLYHCRSVVENTQISNTLGHCVAVVGGWTEFVHCTLAQFYPWDAARGDALYLANQWLALDYPLQHAHFKNCLMTGYAEDVVMGNLKDEDGSLDYYFGNCLMRTVPSDDVRRFENVVYEPKEGENVSDKQFKLFDTDNFIYDFRLNEKSMAINIGSLNWAVDNPIDRYGVSRMEDTAPDAGCYEYIAE